MAVASGEGLVGTPLMPAGAALALLGVLVYLAALCAACRRKGRKKKVPPDGVKLVDESLLRQTQLRSLSKSDTKLHEFYRVKARDDAQRPVSLDFASPTSPCASSVSVLLHRELPQIPIPEPQPAPIAADQTYSNLLFPSLCKPVPDTVYESLAVGGDSAPGPHTPAGTQVSPPHAGHGTADYACVHKVKKTAEVLDGVLVGLPMAPQCQDSAGTAHHVKLEEMYSTVCKATKKKSPVPVSSLREGGDGWPPPHHKEGAAAGCWTPPEAQSRLDPCYESINDRAWAVPGRSPDPDYEAVDVNWKKVAKRDKLGKPSVPENLYESVGDIWAGEPRRPPARTAASGLEVYITNL